MNSPVDVTYHAFNIIRAILGYAGEIPPFWYKAYYLFRPFLNIQMLIVIRDIFHTFESFTHCDIWQKPITNSMSRFRVLKVKPCINSNTYD